MRILLFLIVLSYSACDNGTSENSTSNKVAIDTTIFYVKPTTYTTDSIPVSFIYDTLLTRQIYYTSNSENMTARKKNSIKNMNDSVEVAFEGHFEADHLVLSLNNEIVYDQWATTSGVPEVVGGGYLPIKFNNVASDAVLKMNKSIFSFKWPTNKFNCVRFQWYPKREWVVIYTNYRYRLK